MEQNALPLKDLHLPAETGWWPLAPGWWGVIGVLAAAAAYLAWRWYRAWRHNAPRRHALRELARIEAAYLEHRDPVTLGAALGLMTFAATVACYIPARRAAAADPVSVLRTD